MRFIYYSFYEIFRSHLQLSAATIEVIQWPGKGVDLYSGYVQLELLRGTNCPE
jgi:hypothetical protein